MKTSRAGVLLTSVLPLLLGLALAVSAAEPKRIVLTATTEVMEKVTLDGNLDEPFWKGAVRLTGFKAAGAEETVVLLVCDRLNLYGGVVCKQAAEKGESVTFVLRSEIEQETKPPCQVRVTQPGAVRVVNSRAITLGGRKGIQPAGGVAAGGGEWRAELKIPLEVFGATGHDAVWLMNIVRNQAGAPVVWSGEQDPCSSANLGTVEFKAFGTVPGVAVPRVGGSGRPKMDGLPDEPMWQHAGVVGNLFPVKGTMWRRRTVCRFLQRGDKIYVVCHLL